MKISDLRNKRIAVLGLSVEGISTAKFLINNNLPVTLLDQKETSLLGSDARQLSESSLVKFRTGEGYLKGLEDFEVIFRTPGYPLWEEHLSEVSKKGIVVSSQTKLFFNNSRGTIIGVTGTKGKGTTSTLIYEILKAAGKSVFLGGNIGLPPLDFIEKVTPDSFVVLELSSFQLEDLGQSPKIAVVLMVTSDHLASGSKESPNYHRSINDYLGAKANIIKFQDKEDLAIVNADSAGSLKVTDFAKSKILYYSRKRKDINGAYIDHGNIVFSDSSGKEVVSLVDKVKLRGLHNLENVLAATLVVKNLGVKSSIIQSVLEEFQGLPHRLEYLGNYSGVSFYNDSFSTTPETTIAAIRSFSEPLIIILGGSEKGSDYKPLCEELIKTKNLKALIFIGQTTERILSGISSVGSLSGDVRVFKGMKDMSEVIRLSKKISKDGDVVLLSPACASFDMFRNYKERGELFRKEVQGLAS